MNPAFEAQTKSLPDQLRWATEIEVPVFDRPRSVLVAGMGGSGIAGDFAAVLAERADVRLAVVKGYDLPGWAREDEPLLVSLSYSGDTEETLSVTSQAIDAGLDVMTVSSGGELSTLDVRHSVEVPSGNQPRASLGYLLGSLCRILAAGSVLEDGDLWESADVTEGIYRSGSVGDRLAARLVDETVGRIVIVWAGSTLTTPVAQRWKTQINENAKAPAWWSALPEADHNEIVGWTSLAETTRQHVVVVPLRDNEDHSRVVARFQHTRRLTEGSVPWVEPVESQGTSALARMLSLTAIADLLTLGLAERYAADPEAVELIEELKLLLKES